MTLFTAKPSEDSPEVWIVYDMYEPLPAKPIFVGTMEECGAVADAKNAPLIAARLNRAISKAESPNG